MKIFEKLKIRIIIPAVMIPVAAAVCMYIYNCDISQNIWLLPCSFKELTHLYCPGCGGTRAVWYLLHGDLLASFRHNILLIPLGILVLTVFKFPKILDHQYVSFLLPGTVFAFFVLRNIPVLPFLLLAPPQ